MALMALLAFCAVRGQGGSTPPVRIADAEVTATDALNRTLPGYREVGPPKPGRWVGMFFWFWHGDDRFGKDYNVTEFMKTHPGFLDFTAKPPGGPPNPTFYWGEPIFGYYRSMDPWVMRRQLALISRAGVDFLFLDYTNAILYDKELSMFLNVAEDLKRHGAQVPKLVFFLNSNPDPMVESLYTNWYKPGKYDDMWFEWDGKPLIMSPAPASAKQFHDPSLFPEVRGYFTYRPTWALFGSNEDPHKWRFMDTLQPDGVPRAALGPDGNPEQIVVNKSMGGPLFGNMQSGGVSTYPGFVPTYNDQWLSGLQAKGLFFQHSWDEAIAHPAPMLLVTGWNEWKASVWENPGVVMLGRKTVAGQGYIVDEFNMDFNRDIEPMKGGYFDDYYYQFLANIRRYKGIEPPQAFSALKSIDLGGPLSQWDSVTPVYRDPKGKAAERRWSGTVPATFYFDQSERNIIVLSQVAEDRRNIYFRAQTVDPISPPPPPSEDNWMLLRLKTGTKPNWNGYDFQIGRFRTGNRCSIERCVDGAHWLWRPVGEALYRVQGRDLVVAVPRSLLGRPTGFEFKWSDNVPDFPTLEDFYTKGDVSPEGRLNFVWRETQSFPSHVH